MVTCSFASGGVHAADPCLKKVTMRPYFWNMKYWRICCHYNTTILVFALAQICCYRLFGLCVCVKAKYNGCNEEHLDSSFGCVIHQSIVTLAEIDVKNTVYGRILIIKTTKCHDANYPSNKEIIEGYKRGSCFHTLLSTYFCICTNADILL